MIEYNDTNVGAGMYYDSPEDKEIEKLRGQISKIKAVNADLLEALEEAVQWDSHDSEGVPALWLEKARAAIAKAKGEA